MDVADLKVSTKVDLTGFEAGLAEMRRQLNEFDRQMSSSFKGVSTSVGAASNDMTTALGKVKQSADKLDWKKIDWRDSIRSTDQLTSSVDKTASGMATLKRAAEDTGKGTENAADKATAAVEELKKSITEIPPVTVGDQPNRPVTWGPSQAPTAPQAPMSPREQASANLRQQLGRDLRSSDAQAYREELERITAATAAAKTQTDGLTTSAVGLGTAVGAAGAQARAASGNVGAVGAAAQRAGDGMDAAGDAAAKAGSGMGGMGAAAAAATPSIATMTTGLKLLALGIAGIAAALGIGLATAFTASNFISQTLQAEKAQTDLATALRLTGEASGQSIDGLNAHADALSKLSGSSDEAVAAAQAVLLSFRSIQGETFERATEAALDMSAALGVELPAAAARVGQALQDPIAGIGQLHSMGIMLSEGQKRLIQDFINVGDKASAQAIILKELEGHYTGLAEVARDSLGGAIKNLGSAWNDLFDIGSAASDPLRAAIDSLATSLEDPAFQNFVELIGTAMFKAMALAVNGAEMLVGALGGVPDALSNISNSLSDLTSLLGTLVQVIGVLITYKLAVWATGAATALYAMRASFTAAAVSVTAFGATMTAMGTAMSVAAGAVTLLSRALALINLPAALITAGVVGVYKLYDAYKTAAKGAEELAAAQARVNEAMNQSVGAISKATVETWKKAAADANALMIASELRLEALKISAAQPSARTTPAIQAELTAAIDAETRTLARATVNADNFNRTLDAVAKSAAVSKTEITRFNDVTDKTALVFESANRSLGNFSNTASGVGAGLGTITNTFDALGASVRVTSGSISDMTSAAKDVGTVTTTFDALGKAINVTSGSISGAIGNVNQYGVSMQGLVQPHLDALAAITSVNDELTKQQAALDKELATIEQAKTAPLANVMGRPEDIALATEALRTGVNTVIELFGQLEKGTINAQKFWKEVDKVKESMKGIAGEGESVDPFIDGLVKALASASRLVDMVKLLSDTIRAIPNRTVDITIRQHTIMTSSGASVTTTSLGGVTVNTNPPGSGTYIDPLDPYGSGNFLNPLDPYGEGLGDYSGGVMAATVPKQPYQFKLYESGFAQGGFTGPGPIDKIAGVVHGGEYVFDAETTKRIGVGNLDAIRRSVLQRGGIQDTGGRQEMLRDRREMLRDRLLEMFREGRGIEDYRELFRDFSIPGFKSGGFVPSFNGVSMPGFQEGGAVPTTTAPTGATVPATGTNTLGGETAMIGLIEQHTYDALMELKRIPPFLETLVSDGLKMIDLLGRMNGNLSSIRSSTSSASGAGGGGTSSMGFVAAVETYRHWGVRYPGGLKEGGFTGNKPVDQIAGFVHGGEYVMDAATTKAIGVANLDAIRKGVRGYQTGGAVSPVSTTSATATSGGSAQLIMIEQNTHDTVIELQRLPGFLETIVSDMEVANELLKDIRSGIGKISSSASSSSSSSSGPLSSGSPVETGMRFAAAGPVYDTSSVYHAAYAEGGISDRPAIFGEAGPEAAVPLKNGKIPVEIKGGTKGGTTVNMGGIHINVPPGSDAMSPRSQLALLDAVERRVRQALSRP